MNANLSAPENPPAPRVDAKFIEDHALIERYLDGKLPVKGARDLENWCRDNPAYLDGLRLAERAAATLQLLEACGRPVDLSEPQPPWWKSPLLPIASGILATLSVLALLALVGKNALLKDELADLRTRMHQGSLVQPATQQDLRLTPDRAPGIDQARILVTHGTPRLVDLHLDLSYLKEQQFRLIVDKQDQGRALIVNNLLKDSNGELRLTFNTTGLDAGLYHVRIEALPFRGSGASSPIGWLILEAR